MEDQAKQIEALLEKVVDYGKTTFELAKLKALDKTSDVISSGVPHAIVLALLGIFILFLSLGCAFWLGEFLGALYAGFLLVAAFLGILSAVIHFFFHKWIKRRVRDFIIKQVYN